MFRLIRITILLYILAFFVVGAYVTRVVSTNWEQTLIVTIHPIAGDASTETLRTLGDISIQHFDPLKTFFQREAERYGVKNKEVVNIQLGNRVAELPPALPDDGGLFSRIVWGFKMRFWSYQQTRNDTGIRPNVRLFVIYHQPSATRILETSVGLQKGMFGIVHAFAGRDFRGSNQLVMAHELLHTLGATDKYQPANGLPRFPEGFAEPEKRPLFPQVATEIMGGRRPINENEAEIPGTLRRVVIGPLTAAEIRLLTALE